MSRRNNNSKIESSGSVLQQLPPSHPAENNLEHRSFLIRSINRNDVDLAAIVELNRSLHAVKKSIIKNCGESVLLDLGEGKLKLSADSESLEGEHVPDEGHDLCIDFLLRMKLRRRLLNRLVRRLNRIAHTMDGNDASPPIPPKYGDLRLHIDEQTVEEYATHWEEQERAIRRIEIEREARHLNAVEENVDDMDVDESAEEKEDGEVAVKTEEDAELDDSSKSGERTDKDVEKEESNLSIGDDAPMEIQSQNVAGDGIVASSATRPATTLSSDVLKVVSNSAEDVKPQRLPEKSSAPKPDDREEDHHDPLAVDHAVLCDFDEAYEKKIDPRTGAVAYTILEEEHEDDYLMIKNNAGIGATYRAMTTKEKEAEYNRWKTSILSRIPDQPTFEDLGMQNRVFAVEERRKRVSAESLASPSKKKKTEASEEDDKSDGDSESSSLDEKEESDGNDTDHKEEEDDDEESDESEDDEKEEEKEKKKGTDSSVSEKEDEEDSVADSKQKENALKIIKPISLVPVPSFYDQDLKRVRMVHAELLMTSMHNHAQQRLEHVTREYNTALRFSNELSERRANCQQRLTSFLYDNRSRLNKLKNDYSVNMSVAKNRWNKKRQMFEHEKLNKVLPSRWGRACYGTPLTRMYGSRDPTSNQVATTLADIIDAVEGIAQGTIHNPVFNEPYFPPEAPDLANAIVDQKTGETFLQHSQRVEAHLRNEINTLTAKLKANEEERARLWRKMMKTKAEFEIPHHHSQGIGHMPAQIDPTQLSSLPVPNLRQSETIAHQAPQITSQLPSYTPNRTFAVRPSTSTSKYSAARVRERIAVDGTVAPASEPKKGKDGLYQRPAGRTRKGMDWDAVLGKWVPTTPGA